MSEAKRIGRLAALCAALLVAGLGLAGCGDDEAVDSQPTAVEDSGDSGGSGAGASEEPAPAGEALPDDWPAEFLVPDGTIALVIPMGGGYSLTVEGVDDAQAQGLIDEMVGAGLSTTAGVTDMGNGEWTAEVASGEYRASYAYASGGAGLPNVTITLVPNAS